MFQVCSDAPLAIVLLLHRPMRSRCCPLWCCPRMDPTRSQQHPWSQNRKRLPWWSLIRIKGSGRSRSVQ
jgi:hypothetical protein